MINCTQHVQRSFQLLKDALTTAPVLRLPHFDKPFEVVAEKLEVVADASGFALGAILLQDGHPVAFESRKLKPAEMNYHPGELEFLAIVYALQKFRAYVLNEHFTLVTDHKPNVGINSQQSIHTWSGRKARWAEFLQQYNFEFVYRAGSKNVADPLSRRSDYKTGLMAITRRAARSANGGDSAPIDQTSPPVSVAPDFIDGMGHHLLSGGAGLPLSDSNMTLESAFELKDGLAADGCRANPAEGSLATACRLQMDVGSVGLREAISSNYGPAFLESIKGAGCTQVDNLWFKDDLLVIPTDELRKDLLRELHDQPYSGHVGVSRTEKNVRAAKIWWPGWKLDVSQYVQTCSSCARNKPFNANSKGLLIPLAVPEHLWETVSMDFITELPITDGGFDTILVVVDKLSKMCHLIPTTFKGLTAEKLAHLFFDGVIKHHGFPVTIVSDRDKLFTSRFWEMIHELAGTKLARSTAFHPQTDGQTERYNRILEDMLRHYISPLLNNWDRLLSCAEFAINNSFVEGIGATPFYLNMGWNPRTPIQVHLAELHKTHDRVLSSPRAADFVSDLQTRVSKARQLLLAAQQRMRERVNAHRTPKAFEVGDEVLLSTKNLTFTGPNCKKFLPRFIGPFVVEARHGPVAYRLNIADKMPRSRIHPVFHVELLKQYRADGRYQPPPPVLTLEGEEEYEVERILDHKQRGNKTRYLIRWAGYGPEHDLWEPASSLANAPEALADYWSFVGKTRSRQTSKR